MFTCLLWGDNDQPGYPFYVRDYLVSTKSKTKKNGAIIRPDKLCVQHQKFVQMMVKSWLMFS